MKINWIPTKVSFIDVAKLIPGESVFRLYGEEETYQYLEMDAYDWRALGLTHHQVISRTRSTKVWLVGEIDSINARRINDEDKLDTI